jgi:hypothetical protein
MHPEKQSKIKNRKSPRPLNCGDDVDDSDQGRRQLPAAGTGVGVSGRRQRRRQSGRGVWGCPQSLLSVAVRCFLPQPLNPDAAVEFGTGTRPPDIMSSQMSRPFIDESPPSEGPVAIPLDFHFLIFDF